MDKQRLDDLRKRAAERFGFEKDPVAENSDAELRKTLHELRTHQIELELQNEELRQVQEELVESRNQYVDLYDFAPVGYLTVSDKNLIEEANLTLADLLGEERRSLLGRPFSRFIFPEDQEIFYKQFREIVASQKRQACELRMRRKAGDWFWAKLECVPRARNDKGGMLIRIALQDITEPKHLELEIMKAKKLEATALLAGGIAHDFNNLLAVILGNLELAQKDMANGLPVADKLQVARDASLRAADLTQKFLTFSSGGEPFKKLISVKTFITNSVSLILAGSNVDFECLFPDDLWPVEVDAAQMAQAIGNVVANAREAMPQGGVIRIRAENVDPVPQENRKILSGPDAKYVRISIQDQGVGIPDDILPQVFDPYFSSKEMGQKKGLGLGLAIAYSIIKKHGGFIDIASQQHVGTTVSMYLPASNKQVILRQESRPQPALPLILKVLVMDDEEMIRNITRHVLERLGYEVETACDGEEAIRMYTQAQRSGSPFGAVILDLTVKGGMGGREAIKRLKELDPEIRAIVASGYSNDPVMANCREYGFLAALNKPYKLSDLEKVLEDISGERHSINYRS